MRKLKRGYTIAEMMLCLSAATLVIIGAFTLYGKIHLSFIQQSERNNQVYTVNSVFLELNDMLLNGYGVSYSDGKLYIDDDIISVSDNSIYKNGKQMLTSDKEIKLSVVNERIIIQIGGKHWCFTSINGVT